MNRHERPGAGEMADWYRNYVERVSANDVIAALEEGQRVFEEMWPKLKMLPPEYRYAPEKWSVSQMLQHLIDSEWVFAYRALRFARNDQTELPGYDHDAYADETNHAPLDPLAEQFRHVRTATISLFNSIPTEAGLRAGVANERPCSVRALGFIIAGHQMHHLDILRERYLSDNVRNG